MKDIHDITALAASILFMTWSLFSCSDRNELTPSSTVSPGREQVEISLKLSVQDILDATGAVTKGPKSDTLTHSESSEIKNLWILQFDGTSEEDTLLFCHYYEDYSTMPDAINVIASGERTNRLYFVANTFNGNIAFGSAKTIGQARQKWMPYIGENVVHSETVAGQTVHYPIMNGYVDQPISTGPVSCTLERSVARIYCNVKCSVSGMTVQSITLCSVPEAVPCLTKGFISGVDCYPEQSEMSVKDFEPTLWSDGVVKEGDASVRQFSFYVPCNKRGVTSNTNPKLKAVEAPIKSTYARIIASFDDGGVSRTASYTFYLGANLTNDFNLLPNHKYTYNLSIDRVGNPDTDFRVSMDYVDYRHKDAANCYMVQPPVKGTWKSYIIPIKRVFEFWNGYAGNALKSLEQTNCPGWEMEVIWSDMPLNIAAENQSRGDVSGCNFKWRKASKKYLNGTGEKVDVLNDYFEFEISDQVRNANILVGIRRFSNDACTEYDDGYLWSWHIWITEYNPYRCETFTPQIDAGGDDVKFVYEVPGGAVHRYKGNMWNADKNGELKGKFIMDRNLGSRTVNVFSSTNELYYQFGHKDPFPGQTLYNVRQARKNISSDATGAENNVEYSVMWPNVFFLKSNDWTVNALDKNGTAYNSSGLVWQDTKRTTGKSIFDPCPEGWRLPKNGVWDDFNVSAATRFKYGDPNANGRTYLPTGITGTIYYPASGYLHADYGGTFCLNYGFYWTCTPSGASSGLQLYFNYNAVHLSSGSARACACPVRCVQE